jgi:2-phosphosulfolactate phosphatase
MKFHYTNLDTCHEATGVVVIDVIRAFTNAAFAFSKGAKEIYPVSTVEEALHFKSKPQNSLACGEVGGVPPDGFNFGNSPMQTNTLDLSGCVIVQRTGAGTQGIVRSVNAEHMLAASLVMLSSTLTQTSLPFQDLTSITARTSTRLTLPCPSPKKTDITSCAPSNPDT